jgi:hypothetical protein
MAVARDFSLTPSRPVSMIRSDPANTRYRSLPPVTAGPFASSKGAQRMAWKCRKCKHVVEDFLKPSECPGCHKKNTGFDHVKDDSKKEVTETKEYEWETFAKEANTQETVLTSLKDIANTNGLPDENCLAALLKAIDIPTPQKQGINFTVICANYDSKEKKLNGKHKLIDNKKADSTGHGADKCAELAVWEAIKADVGSSKPYLGFGQSKCPCDLCCARYAGLAKAKSLTIIVCYSEGYDKRPPNEYLIFSNTGTVFASKAKKK